MVYSILTYIYIDSAGVTGLTTAYLLSEKGYQVSIKSKKFHFDGFEDHTYTSNFAGANWASFASHDQLQLQEFDKPGYLRFISLARNNPLKSGVHLQYNVSKITKKSFELNCMSMDKIEDYLPWYKDFVEEFKFLSSSELGDEFAFGYSYLGVVISTTTYLGYLFNKCIDNGVTYKRHTVNNITDFLTNGELDYVINCTGISSRSILGVEDPSVYPIRGQTVVVENNFPFKLSVKVHDPEHPNESFYLMPRVEGGCVIGGCQLSDNWDSKPDLDMSTRILNKALRFCPQLVDPNYQNNPTTLKVVRHQVGLRPGRKGDVRVERDPLNDRLIHNYGAGGTGFQSSYGTCSKVVAIVDSILLKSKL